MKAIQNIILLMLIPLFFVACDTREYPEREEGKSKIFTRANAIYYGNIMDNKLGQYELTMENEDYKLRILFFSYLLTHPSQALFLYEGTYNPMISYKDNMTFLPGSATKFWDKSSDTDGISITGGYFTIEHFGFAYTISSNLIGSDGKKVGGYFKGQIPITDLSE